jgi:glycosyltransferase involved in cell wall biosynthesis
VRKKGFEYLVDAMPAIARRHRAVLAVAGEGDLEAELRGRAARLPEAADRIRFLGKISQDDVARYLAAADVTIVPSVRDDAGNVDGLPNVVMEALASGTPLVTTAAGGIGTIVAHERTALVVPERDPAALADAVVRLLDDAALREAVGGAARSLAAARFGWAQTAERLEDAYARALVLSPGGR